MKTSCRAPACFSKKPAAIGRMSSRLPSACTRTRTQSRCSPALVRWCRSISAMPRSSSSRAIRDRISWSRSRSPRGGERLLQTMPKHLFQSFWWGPLSPYERLCLNSFIDRGHTFDLYTYDPNLAVPAGVQLLDAAAILDQSEFFVYDNEPGRGSPSAFANLFRYKLLRDKGGWWVDTDV